MTNLKKEIVKHTIAAPVGLCAGKVAMDVIENVLPSHVRVPVKIVRYVGTAALGLVADTITYSAVSDVFDNVDQTSEIIKESRRLKKKELKLLEQKKDS